MVFIAVKVMPPIPFLDDFKGKQSLEKIELGYTSVLVLRKVIASLNFVSLSCSGEVTVSLPVYT